MALAHLTINLDAFTGDDRPPVSQYSTITLDPGADHIDAANDVIHVRTIVVSLDQQGKAATANGVPCVDGKVPVVAGVAYAVSAPNVLRGGPHYVPALTAAQVVDLSDYITPGAPLTPDQATTLTARIVALEETPLHAHSNKAALDLVSGTNTGDQVLPTWSTISGKPAVVAEGATQAAARTAIGAGTSSFSGAYADLSGKPTLGTAAATASTDYATAAQGAKADTAVQPGDLIVNVRDFGATGDGATDDTVAIQAAINSLTPAASSAEFAGAGAGAVYLPPGEYVVTNLTMRANVSIRGAGYRATALIATGTGGYTLDTTGLTNTNRIANVEVSGLTIGPTGGAFGLAGTRPAVGGINLGYSQWCVVRDVFIHNIAGVGLNLTQAFDLNTYNTHIMYTGTTASPAVLMAGDADNTCNANHHFGMRVERCPKMLRVTGATHPPVNNEFIGCKFEWNTAGQPTTTGPAIDIEHAVQLKFSECMFVSDTITYPSVSIGAASGATTQGVRFIGCEWNTPTGRSGWAMTSTAKAADVDMIGCHVLNAGKGITLDPATRGTFVSNRTYNCTAPVIDGVGLQLVSNRFLETYTTAASVYTVRVSSNSRVVGNHVQGVVSGQRPDGISASNNTIVTSNLLDQLVVGISFFGTGAKERSNQFLNVFTPLAGSTVTNSQDQSLTDAEKAALHTHPAVIAQGATQADARTAIGAGTSSFSGAYADLTGKPTTMTPTAHAATHAAAGSDPVTLTSAQISDLTEAVQDIVGAFIVAGTNVTVTYNDAANTFTINA